MKIAVFSPDLPYPPIRGGKADVWRRIEAFRSLGHEVMLVNMQEATGPKAPNKKELEHVDLVVNARFSFHIKRGFSRTARQLALSWLVPWHASTRIPDAVEKKSLVEMLDQFAPDFIWLDGPWFAVIGFEFKKRYQIPLLYRSHNIEHVYLHSQARVAVRLRDRMAWTLVCLGLRRFETNAIRNASAVFDISVDDLQYWETAGIHNMHWLPPLPELVFKAFSVNPIDGDLVFIGNLGTPNNVRGVEWLVKEVLPRVRKKLPQVRCRIVGSNPTAFVSQLIAAADDVELCANVPDPMPYLFGAKVLVNPVMSGSGVQVKMLDMLMSDAPIVTASQGTRGLPPEFKCLFRVADDADTFAQAVFEEMVQSSVDVPARARAREVFSVAAVGKALDISVKLKDVNVNV